MTPVFVSNGKTRLLVPRHKPINAIIKGGIPKPPVLTPGQFRGRL